MYIVRIARKIQTIKTNMHTTSVYVHKPALVIVAIGNWVVLLLNRTIAVKVTTCRTESKSSAVV